MALIIKILSFLTTFFTAYKFWLSEKLRKEREEQSLQYQKDKLAADLKPIQEKQSQLEKEAAEEKAKLEGLTPEQVESYWNKK